MSSFQAYSETIERLLGTCLNAIRAGGSASLLVRVLREDLAFLWTTKQRFFIGLGTASVAWAIYKQFAVNEHVTHYLYCNQNEIHLVDLYDRPELYNRLDPPRVIHQKFQCYHVSHAIYLLGPAFPCGGHSVQLR